ncbi:MAG: 50S ribosomal protein L11 methyltransferase [Limnobacter sp.]|nr:50S ribosomal protein L11 methyltransferase [Limnobacter sp.]
MGKPKASQERTQQATPLVQITLTLPFELADEVSDLLLELGALAVGLEDAQANTDAEQPQYGEPGMEPETFGWHINHVKVLCRSQTEAHTLLAELPLDDAQRTSATFSQVPQEDWVRLTQSQFEPVCITDTLWVVPSWHEAVQAPGRINLTLDPGLAFGTGTHPTTALCLRWLCENPPVGQPVLDYGCGSGILGIAALKLGASQAIGVDVDTQAIASTAYNAQRNQVEMACGQPDLPAAKGQFPVVLANILSNPLKLLAPSLCAHVQADGHLVLSGVLARQAEEVMACYRPWMNMRVWAERDGWVCLHGTRLHNNPTHERTP